MATSNYPGPTSSGATGRVPIAGVVDAVNAVEDTAARRLIIHALRERLPAEAWTTRDGFLLVNDGSGR